MPQAQTAEKVIDIPGVGNISFPSTMTDAQIDAAAAKLYRDANPDQPGRKPKGWVSTALDWLPTAGGAIGGIVGGIGGTVAGMGIGGAPGAIGGAALGGAAGKALQTLGRVATGEEAPKDYGEGAASIATEGAIQGATQAVGVAVAPVMTRAAGALMQSAVKPGIRATARAVARGVSKEELPVVSTLLEEGVNVSPGGISKLNRIITATNDEIKTAVNTLPGSVDPVKVSSRAMPVLRRAQSQANPTADVKAVTDSATAFLQNPATTRVTAQGTRVPTSISLPEAQALKQGTYRALGEKPYGSLATPAIETEKALARGLKEEIEREALKSGVKLGPLNAREGAAITAKEAVANRLAAAGNRDPVALAWLAANPTAGLLFILERSPAVKSMLARGLYQSAAKASKVPENVLRLMVGAIASSPDEEGTE